MGALSQPLLQRQASKRLNGITARPATSFSLARPRLHRVPEQQQQRCRASPAGGSSDKTGRVDKRQRDVGFLDALEVAVPRDQRPANELQQLKEDMLYSWVCPGRVDVHPGGAMHCCHDTKAPTGGSNCELHWGVGLPATGSPGARLGRRSAYCIAEGEMPFVTLGIPNTCCTHGVTLW